MLKSDLTEVLGYPKESNTKRKQSEFCLRRLSIVVAILCLGLLLACCSKRKGSKDPCSLSLSLSPARSLRLRTNFEIRVHFAAIRVLSGNGGKEKNESLFELLGPLKADLD